MHKNTDEELIEFINCRNTKALQELYSRFNIGIYNFVLRYTNKQEVAEDILQETFTRVWFASHTFNPNRGSVKTWIFTIALNITRNEMSLKRYSYQYIDIDEVFETTAEVTDDKINPYDILEDIETKDRLTKAIESLNPYLKEIILLKHFQGLKFKEIAEMTNTPEGTLKARFHNALSMLKKTLKKEK